MTTNAALLDADLRALERARVEGVHVFPITPTTWVATTTAGNTYRLEVSRHNVRCDCPAGRYGRVCKHAALVRHVRGIMLPVRVPKQAPEGLERRQPKVFASGVKI